MKQTINVPTEVKKALSVQNANGWHQENECTYYPDGDNPNIETNRAIVYHQTKDGSYITLNRYAF